MKKRYSWAGADPTEDKPTQPEPEPEPEPDPEPEEKPDNNEDE